LVALNRESLTAPGSEKTPLGTVTSIRFPPSCSSSSSHRIENDVINRSGFSTTSTYVFG
jgi:hypothetical protein